MLRHFHFSPPFFLFFFFMILPPPTSTLFPYTTLFRSFQRGQVGLAGRAAVRGALDQPGRVHAALEALRLARSEEHTSELQSRVDLVCRLLLEKKKKKKNNTERMS